MKKRFLDNLSEEFPNELNCSSIRINAEEQENNMPKRKEDKFGNQLNVGPKLKKYEQNDIVGFQMSLEYDDNRQNLLELMRSKSLRDMNHSKQEKSQNSKKQKQLNVNNGGSLYNTSSFDEMTMNITANMTANMRMNNMTNFHTHTESLEFDKNTQKTLNKPNEMLYIKQTFFDQKMTININKEKQARIKIVDHQERRNPAILLDALKRSMNQDEQPLQKLQQEPSYEEPYFKVGSMRHLNSGTKNESEANKLFIQDHRRDIKKMTSADTKFQDKKLTLRDYMYLSNLSGKNREKSNINEDPASPQFKKSMSTSRSRRKFVPSNNEVMQKLKKQVTKNIELVKGNMNLLLEFMQSSEIDEEVSQKELMRMYSFARILKDKIVNANDQLVIMLQEAYRQ